MAGPQWHDRLDKELRRQRLPAAYIARLLEELSDHFTDMSREDAQMEADEIADTRLGCPKQLAAVAKSEFQRRTFAGRHPLVTFIAGPVLTMIGSLVAVFLVLFLLCWSIDAVMGGIDVVMGGRLSANDDLKLSRLPFETSILRFFGTAARFVPFVFSAWLFCRIGRRTGLHAWSIGACGIVVLTAGCFSSVLTPATGDSEPTWVFGLAGHLGFDQIMQALVPAAFAVWLIWQYSGSRPSSAPFATN